MASHICGAILNGGCLFPAGNLKKMKTSYMSYYNIEVKGLNQNKTSEVDGVKNELIAVGTVHCRIRERNLCFLQAFNGIYNRSSFWRMET